MEGLTGRLTGCEKQGLVGQVSHVTSDVDKMDLNNKGYSEFFLRLFESDFTFA